MYLYSISSKNVKHLNFAAIPFIRTFLGGIYILISISLRRGITTEVNDKFGSYLSPVICRRDQVLFTLFVLVFVCT